MGSSTAASDSGPRQTRHDPGLPSCEVSAGARVAPWTRCHFVQLGGAASPDGASTTGASGVPGASELDPSVLASSAALVSPPENDEQATTAPMAESASVTPA